MNIRGRTRVIHNAENRKLPCALNIGFRLAKGEYLTWTSDDNVYLPEAFSKMVGFLDNNKVAMVCADMGLIDESGELKSNRKVYDPFDLYYENFVGACFLYKNSVLYDVGEYDESSYLAEDYDYWLRIRIQYGEIGHLNEILYKYREHRGSLSARKRNEIRIVRNILRRKYSKEILQFYSEDNNKSKSRLLWMYMDWFVSEKPISKFEEELKLLVPEIEMICKLDKDEDMVVYGAGNRGTEAFEKYGERITTFIDHNAQSIVQKNGRPVITLNKFLEEKNNSQILVAVGRDLLLEILEAIQLVGIRKCSILWED